MESRNYWHTVFSVTTWQEFTEHGSSVAGFPMVRWGLVKKIKPGDYLLCYVTKICRWIALLEVVSEPFIDETLIWQKPIFPCRVSVRVVISLTLETGMPMKIIKDTIPLFKNFKDQKRWGVFFQTSPFPWSEIDAEVVIKALKNAELNPVIRPIKNMESQRFGKARLPYN